LKIVCIGQLVADILVRPVSCDCWQQDTTRVETISLQTGGDSFNIAINLAALGLPVAMVGRVGGDHLGDFLRSAARRAGVDDQAILTIPTSVSTACIALIQADGQRNFLYQGGASDGLREEDVPDHLLREAKLVHLGGAFQLRSLDGEGAARVLRRARAHGARTSLDVTWDSQGRWMKLLRPVLAEADIFLPSEEEARQLCQGPHGAPEELARALLACGPSLVGVKLGDKGCYLSQADGQSWFIPALPAQVLDTTGAGDSFVAGFLAGLFMGWEIPRSARLGSALAALCVEGLGATAGARPLEQVLAASGRRQ